MADVYRARISILAISVLVAATRDRHEYAVIVLAGVDRAVITIGTLFIGKATIRVGRCSAGTVDTRIERTRIAVVAVIGVGATARHESELACYSRTDIEGAWVAVVAIVVVVTAAIDGRIDACVVDARVVCT